MKRPEHMKTPIVRLGWQRGQTSVEYIMITALVGISAMGLFWIFPDTPDSSSIAALLKSMFGAYSFALSLP